MTTSLISVVIPTLNEAASIGATLDALFDADAHCEIIIADGGSTDATLSVIENYPVKIVKSRRGRGTQLKNGAQHANGDFLWFVHADTTAAPECFRQMRRVLEDQSIAGGNFTIRFDGERSAAKFLSWLYPKLNALGLIYGDSAIFVRRDIYDKIGGFREYPIFEDLDFVERLRKIGAVVTLPAVVETSSRRFAEKSFALTFARWTFLQILYWCGVSPEKLVKIYFPAR